METKARVSLGQTLRRDSLPMRLFDKFQKYGQWNPHAIDFSVDKEDWKLMSPLQQEFLQHLPALFQAGEQAVLSDLLPLVQVINQEGRLEESIFLTTFLYDEAKHATFFHRFFAEVVGEPAKVEHFASPHYNAIFEEALPQAMQRLAHDPSPEAQVEAAVIYNIFVEGVLAETGYYAMFHSLEGVERFPGKRQGIGWIKRDESRHIAYGVYLLSRLIAAQPSLWNVVEDVMSRLLQPALMLINDIFSRYEEVPFSGLEEDKFIDFATQKLQKRLERLERCRNATLDEVEQFSIDALVDDDS